MQFCKIGLVGEKELLKHQGKGGNNKYRCGVKQKMEMLRMAKNGERKHACLVCGLGFMNKKCLTDHAVVHTNDKDFRCDKCTKS